LGEIRHLQCFRAHGDAQGFLQHGIEPVFAHPLAPPRQRRAVERQFVAEERLATEQLEIRVLDPAVAQPFVGQIVRVL
jgi:hypothetical protein